MVGITNQMYKDITLTPEEMKTKVWVFLDTGEIVWPTVEPYSNIPDISFFELSHKIDIEYKSFSYKFTSTR